MNIDGSDGFLKEPGEEIIPSDYKAVVLPPYLQAIRHTLYGANPDRLMLNYRTRQYLALLHATELEDYVLALDNRITYQLDSKDLNEVSYRPVAVRTAGDSSAQLWLMGDLDTPTITGRMKKEWTVSVDTGDTIKITTHNPYAIKLVAYELTGGISNIVSLPNSTLSIRINSYSVGAKWRIESISRPNTDVGVIAEALKGAVNSDLLFSGGEPFSTFRTYWEEHYALPYKLGGLLLAYIYKIEASRS